jgi:hypothetical protein
VTFTAASITSGARCEKKSFSKKKSTELEKVIKRTGKNKRKSSLKWPVEEDGGGSVVTET